MLEQVFGPVFDAVDRFFCEPKVDAARIFHGRGQCYERLTWLTIDWFDPVVYAVVYQPLDPADKVFLERFLTGLVVSFPAIRRVDIQYRQRPDPYNKTLAGDSGMQVLAREDGLSFYLNIEANQNIGFFLDASPARQWVKANALGKNVLNLFAYTCAYSLFALEGGARQVVNMDMSKSALSIGQKNHHLNKKAMSGAVFLPHEIFRSLSRLKRFAPFDLVIIDPPSRQPGSFILKKDYPRLLKKLQPFLSSQGDILACVNSPIVDDNYLEELFHQVMPDVSYITRLANRADFVEKNPVQALKMQIFRRG